MINEQLRPYLNDLISEHRQMHRLKKRLEEALMRAKVRGWGSAAAREAGAALAALHDHAVHHFGREEAEGCFEDAMAISPQCGARVDEIRAEHVTLLAVLDELTREAKRDVDRPEAWPNLTRRIRDLLGRLADHERCESQLIADVFNVALEDV